MNTEDYFRCERDDCFQNKNGKCFLLTEPTRKMRHGEECPFFKTLEQIENEELKVYGHVLHRHKEHMGC